MTTDTSIAHVFSRPAACIAVLGTGSDVGKSIVVTAICRHLANQGLRVAPYKSQNMSNNSGVTPEGLEMGRAQIVQAEAARVVPHVDMNPILLKPTSEIGSQVVVMGKALSNQTAADYHRQKSTLWKTACRALDCLRRTCDVVVMEGAGSCAEVNLMSHDLVNLSMAAYADAPVILVGDIHRGGIFAQMVGTLACLPEKDAARIRALLINRFRGDIALFSDGVDWLHARTGRPVLGVLPWFDHIRIEAEDSVVIEKPRTTASRAGDGPRVAVIRLPHISNFTDFDPLAETAGLEVVYLQEPTDTAGYSAVIIPGSKNTRYDLAWLQRSGWDEVLKNHQRRGGHVLGICGGYQMMGRSVVDPDGLEGSPGKSTGLGLLPVETVLQAPKTTTVTRFSWENASGRGYEIHMGRTRLLGGRPLLTVHERNGRPCSEADGCLDPATGSMGTYLHGFFDNPDVTSRWLTVIGLPHFQVADEMGLAARDRQYDLLAGHFAEYVDTDLICQLIAEGKHA
jgi:adenosylcobyric acid synthase